MLERAKTSKNSRFRIAIIGGGPKGTYGLERLAAQLGAQPPSRPVEILVFNRTPFFGSGDVYRSDQPAYLLVNNNIAPINMWPDEQPAPVVPDTLRLTEWLQKHKPDDAAETPISDADFVPRALVGQYLEHGFNAIIDHMPAGVICKPLVAEVVDLQTVGSTWTITTRSPEGSRCIYPNINHVLMATGHPRPADTQARFPSAITQIPFVYPVDEKLAPVTEGTDVFIKGMGLTFVDMALALTEGRGGTFVRDPKSKLTYVPSGREPRCLYPFSRSGLPMIPRGPAEAGLPLSVFTAKFTQQYLSHAGKAPGDSSIDFVTDLWPLIELELYIAYYRTAFQLEGMKLTLPLHLTPRQIESDLEEQIETFHKKVDARRFTPIDFLNPNLNQPAHALDHHTFVMDYLRHYLQEVRQGETYSPLMAAVGVWKKVIPLLGKLYHRGGFTPASQKQFEHRYRPMMDRVSFGPPIINMEKIVALTDAGLINFSYSRQGHVSFDAGSEALTLASPYARGNRTATTFIDARIPRYRLPEEAAPVYQNMLQRGICRPFENADHGCSYVPGCPDLSSSGCLIDASGTMRPTLRFAGTPTEGITLDNDTLSRKRNNFVSTWARDVIEAVHHSAITPPSLKTANSLITQP